jgi:hypothetical protein
MKGGRRSGRRYFSCGGNPMTDSDLNKSSGETPGAPAPASGNPLLSLLGRNLLWALGSLAGAVAGAVLMLVTFFVAAFAIGFVATNLLHLELEYDLAARAGEFAAAAGVLIGATFGSYLPLMAIGEGEQRMHEKILATALVIAILFINWRINSDTVFASGWAGLAIAAAGILILAGLSAMVHTKKA